MHQTRELRDGWELASAAPGAFSRPEDLEQLDWSAALVPGTVAGAVADLDVDPDDHDWWFRTSFEAEPVGEGERLLLCLDGIATVAQVYLNGDQVLNSRSMFVAHRLDVSAQVAHFNELMICCRALTPELAVQRRPRARWRTALVNGSLRFVRTMLLGRAAGFAPGPAVVGPWRPVRLERHTGFLLDEVRLRPSLNGGEGVLAVQLSGHALAPAFAPSTVTVSISGHGRSHELTLALESEGERRVARGELRVPAVQRWWPHTHGTPDLYDLSISTGEIELQRCRVGFRKLEWPAEWENAGLSLRINDVAVFARGAVWTPLDMRAPDQPRAALRAALQQVVDAGMNIVRIAGIGCYESDTFHDLCDELGIMVWQDFMLANMDYPVTDSGWRAEFEAEVHQELARIAGRPSLTVLCGGSEVAQQVAMLGLEPELARGEPYMETLPRLIAEAGAAVPYVPNSPWGGQRPFAPDRGVANYYGVGAYLRDLSDARLAEVKFAGECLALSNVPDDATLERVEAPGGLVPHHPAWKAGVPRDAGSGWDFEDVRDHYLRTLYGEDPVRLRSTDLRRYLDLSRSVSGEVMAATFGEWRRSRSVCAGAIILWLRDLRPGAGWGIIDSAGRPKVAYHHLRRALAPVAVWMTGEGLRGISVHLANDLSETLDAMLRVTTYRGFRTPVDSASIAVSLPPHGGAVFDVEELIGRFVDISYAYRFGPAAHDVVVASLEAGPENGSGLIANAFSFPVERPLRQETAERLGLEAGLALDASGFMQLSLKSASLVHGVRVAAAGCIPADDAFTLEPGVQRTVALHTLGDVSPAEMRVSITALNMSGPVLTSMSNVQSEGLTPRR